MQAFSSLGRALLVALLAGGLVACRTLSKKKAPEAAGAPPSGAASPASSTVLPVGIVHHVDPGGGFVLVRSSRSFRIEPGTVLTVRGEQGETTARLEVGPARKGAFLTADILDGAPEAGRHVTLDYAPAPFEGGGASALGTDGPDAVQVLE